MPTIQNQNAASPRLLLICGAVMTGAAALIAANADEPILGLLFFVASGLPFLIAGVVRMRVLAVRGETFLNIEPQPLVCGEDFKGYIETGRALDMSEDTVVLEVVTARYHDVIWESGNLKRALSIAPEGRQRLEFAGTMPQRDELTQQQIMNEWRLRFRGAFFPLSVKR